MKNERKINKNETKNKTHIYNHKCTNIRKGK